MLLAVALAATVRSPGCDRTIRTPARVVGAIAGGIIGNQFGKGGGRVASTLAGAVVGGIVGNEIGRSLDQRDRELAQQAEYDAWERGPPGRPVRWRNPNNGRYGEVIPDELYGAAARDCRDFLHKRLHRRPPADHARHRLPQPRRHLDPGRLIGRHHSPERTPRPPAGAFCISDTTLIFPPKTPFKNCAVLLRFFLRSSSA